MRKLYFRSIVVQLVQTNIFFTKYSTSNCASYQLVTSNPPTCMSHEVTAGLHFPVAFYTKLILLVIYEIKQEKIRIASK